MTPPSAEGAPSSAAAGDGALVQEGDGDGTEPEDWADEGDHEAILQATEGLAPEQTGIALQAVLDALAGTGEVDCEVLAREMMTTPEKAYEAVVTVLDATSRMVTKHLFDGDQDLHSAFARWAIQNEREAYVKASEQVARSQSSKPMRALVQKHMKAVRASAASAAEASKATAAASKKATTAKPQEANPAAAEKEPWWEREEREWYEARGLKY